MYMRNYTLFLLLLIALTLTACRQAETPLPTLLPTAAVPAVPTPIPPTPTSFLPPTRDLGEQAEPTAVPDNRPTNTPAPTHTPTPLIPTITFSSPGAGAEFVMGSDVLVSGLARREMDQRIILLLVTATNHILIETEGTGGDSNQWQASFRVPEAVSGPAELQAYLVTEANEIVARRSVSVWLALDTESGDRYLALARPVAGDTAVAGYTIFFDGYAQRPVNNTVTISLWHEECQTQAARQSFVLGGSGYWHGFLVVPRDLEGPVCAVASFGSPEETPETWREAQLPMTILPAGNETAASVAIAIPAPGSQLTAGESYIARGTAANARETQIVISILLDNGRILVETTAVSDFWGFWETSFVLPPDAEGPAQIYAAIGSPSDPNFAQTQNPITITLP
jgi:hypothetical protein